MPPCNLAQQQEIVDAVRSIRSREAQRLLEALGPEELCRVLHAMRRWYSYNCWNAAKKILPHRQALGIAMDLNPRSVVGAYRGFKTAEVMALVNGLGAGNTVTLPVERNGGCSSWTLGRDLANRFSGGGKGKVGVVVQLASARGVQPFIAPPERTEPWFDQLYRRTMGESFRFKEREYAVASGPISVRLVALKT